MKQLLLFGLLALCQAQTQSGDLDSLINQLFQQPVTSPTPPQASTLVPGVSKVTSQDTSCKTEDGRVGECVNYYLCNTNNSVITDGIGIIDIRVRDGPCVSYLDSCCLPPDTRDVNNPITPPPVTQPQRSGCGWRNPDGVGFRITGDKDGESKFGEFPWAVAILNIPLAPQSLKLAIRHLTIAGYGKVTSGSGNKVLSLTPRDGSVDPRIEPVNNNQPDSQKLNVYVGGGSLIHPSVVLTAAHYVAEGGIFRVRAGEWDTQTTKEIYPYQDRDVSRVIVHQDFNKGNLFYDIALLFLSTPMDLAPNVGLACLPPPNEKTPAGTRCFATGWGKDRFEKEGRYQVILKKVEVPVVDHNTCKDKLRQTRLGHFFELHSTFMCAGGEAGKDTCKGDGGSPLSCPVQYEKDRYMQSGIVAWGIGCGQDGTPGVYVDVSNLREWIDDKVAGAGHEPKVYTI